MLPPTFSEHRAPRVPFAGTNRGDVGSVLVQVHHIRLVNPVHNVISLKELLLYFWPMGVFLLGVFCGIHFILERLIPCNTKNLWFVFKFLVPWRQFLQEIVTELLAEYVGIRNLPKYSGLFILILWTIWRAEAPAPVCGDPCLLFDILLLVGVKVSWCSLISLWELTKVYSPTCTIHNDLAPACNMSPDIVPFPFLLQDPSPKDEPHRHHLWTQILTHKET